jgi:hypothetical protein
MAASKGKANQTFFRHQGSGLFQQPASRGEAAQLLHPQVRVGPPAQKNRCGDLLRSSIGVARRQRLIRDVVYDAAFDSTGFEAGHVSRYFARRSGRKLRRFGKLGTVIDTRTYLNLACNTGQGPWPDDPMFQPAVKEAYFTRPFYYMPADAGLDGENHHRYVREFLGAKTLIPPLRGRPTTNLPPTKYRREMAIALKQKKHKKHYGQRWHIEGTYSQDKRRFGGWLGARNHHTQSREMRLRALLHNIAIILRPKPPMFSTEHCALYFATICENVCGLGNFATSDFNICALILNFMK